MTSKRLDIRDCRYGVDQPLNGGPKILAVLRVAYEDGSADVRDPPFNAIFRPSFVAQRASIHCHIRH